MRSLGLVSSCACLIVVGCSLARSPLRSRADAPVEGVDAPIEPGLDAPIEVVDAPVEPDVPIGLDAPDAPLPDAPACIPGCAGEVVRDCAGPPRDCAAEGQTCRVLTTGPTCTCIDAPARCAPDGRAVESCSAGVLTITPCDGRGCMSPACPMACGGFRPIAATQTVDLCGTGADRVNLTGGECAFEANGEEAGFLIELTTRSRVTLTVRDADDSTDVDTVLYLRSICNDPATQVACDDDVPCAEAPSALGACFDGAQFRQSSITVELERGAYYVITDSVEQFNRGIDWTCGRVELTYTSTPL